MSGVIDINKAVREMEDALTNWRERAEKAEATLSKVRVCLLGTEGPDHTHHGCIEDIDAVFGGPPRGVPPPPEPKARTWTRYHVTPTGDRWDCIEAAPLKEAVKELSEALEYELGSSVSARLRETLARLKAMVGS